MPFDYNRILSDLLDPLPLGIVTIATTGRIASWNSAAESILGWSAEEVIGSSPPVDFLLQEAGQESEIRLDRKDGRSVDVQVRTLP